MAMTKVAKRARVWNRGSGDYKQVVMGDEVYIPAGGSVTVSRRQAIQIKGHYCGKSVKASLEVEPLWEMAEEQEIYQDPRTGQIFPTRASLLKHLGIDESAANEVKNAPKYTCAICEKSFETKEELIADMKKCLAKVEKSAKKETVPA